MSHASEEMRTFQTSSDGLRFKRNAADVPRIAPDDELAAACRIGRVRGRDPGAQHVVVMTLDRSGWARMAVISSWFKPLISASGACLVGMRKTSAQWANASGSRSATNLKKLRSAAKRQLRQLGIARWLAAAVLG
jgi:hypothetical protein